MTIFDLPEWSDLWQAVTAGGHYCFACLCMLPVFRRQSSDEALTLVQEQSGFHLGIAHDERAAGRHAAKVVIKQYRAWREETVPPGASASKDRYFTIAVGGGNTIKNEYNALLQRHFDDVDWIGHVRFIFLEETCNVDNWESARDALVSTFIEPLIEKLNRKHGKAELAERVGLAQPVSKSQMIAHIVDLMTYPIAMEAVATQLENGDLAGARACAQSEAKRYQVLLRDLLGPSFSVHVVICGISKDGGVGAFAPYVEQLQKKRPSVLVLENPDGAISVALGRGILTAAKCISLIISGSHKIRALGRFEMEESAGFEQTVMETPIRMFRQNRELAERVYIFADDRALHFEEGVFRYREKGEAVEIKSEVRDGDESGGIHALLVHGFMGLYSYINLLIRLPSAWQVSALRRGKYAKTLAYDEIFPHYARSLKKIILSNWHDGRPSPIACHSMAGLISDHLLLSMLQKYDDALPELDRLKDEDQRLIASLQAAGIIHISTWAPSDTCHFIQNVKNRRNPRRRRIPHPLPEQPYQLTPGMTLDLKDEYVNSLKSTPAAVATLLQLPGIERTINSMSIVLRHIARKIDLQKYMNRRNAPYGLRILSGRVLEKVSFYGVLKEMEAAMHQPLEYQRRHVKALEAIVKYDIPYLVIVHERDAMVSASRHIQEHEHLLAARLAKERVNNEAALEVPIRLILLGADDEKPSNDLINAHFVIMSTTRDGGDNSRKVTAAMTNFVNGNVARAIRDGIVEPLQSITHPSRSRRH